METRRDKLDANGSVIEKGYIMYGSTIILNDEVVCTLKFVYFPAEQRYKIIGAKPSDTGGDARNARRFITLKKGDRIVPVFMVFTKSDDTPGITLTKINKGEGEGFSVDTFIKLTPGKDFTLDEEPFVSDIPLEDNDLSKEFEEIAGVVQEDTPDRYTQEFRFSSPINNSTSSQGVYFAVSSGEIVAAEKALELDVNLVVEIDGEEYICNTKTGKYFKDGEEYFMDFNTGEMVKVKK